MLDVVVGMVAKHMQQLDDHQESMLNHGLIDENLIHCAEYIIRFYTCLQILMA